MTRAFLLTGLIAMLAACSPNSGDAAPQSTQTAPSVHPVSGLPVVPLKVIHGSKTFAFRVELARTGQEQAKGLMFRATMGPDEGMLFPFDQPRGASFWMRNTVIPLDLIFVGTDGRISNIAANAVPYDETPLQSVGLAKAVLELSGGRAAQLGIVAGDRVEW
jgi:uncharacterized protein